MMARKTKIIAYFGIPLVLLIIIAFLGIINEIISENFLEYNLADDCGLKGLAIAILYSPILYLGIMIIYAPLMWFVLKNISKARIIMLRIVLLGSLIISIIFALVVPIVDSNFFTLFLLFEFSTLLIGIIWILLTWMLLSSGIKYN